MSTRAGTWLLWAFPACIIPDRGITFEGGPDNEFAVRILERSPLPSDMVEFCNADANDKDERRKIDLTFCPPVRRTQPGGLVRSEDEGPFCICAGGRDLRAIEAFSIYAEDADLDGDSARDRLYGTFLLDPDPFGDEVRPAYDRYWSPAQLAVQIDEVDTERPDPSSGRVRPSQARDVPPQWEFRIDDGSGFVDLCNGEDNVGPGLHNLQFIVTDRPWFSVPHFDPDPDDDDVPKTTVPKIGVPDLAGGASYAVINYVFECVDALADAEDDPRAEDCQCDE